MRVVCGDSFYGDMRGPTLLCVHLYPGTSQLAAIDYQPPDSDGSPKFERHLLFHRSQVHMFTPEEVAVEIIPHEDTTCHGVLVSLGRTPWLLSFIPRHLKRCEHYRAMFYDEFLDVICEGVTSEQGLFISNNSFESDAAEPRTSS